MRDLVPGLQDRTGDGQPARGTRQWAQRQDFEITSEYVFEVSASNGSTRHREMLGQALADARLGRFEVMLVWALDRVSREGVEATLATPCRVRRPPHRSVVAQGTVDRTANPRMAELLASLYAWMAAEDPAPAGSNQGRARAP